MVFSAAELFLSLVMDWCFYATKEVRPGRVIWRGSGVHIFWAASVVAHLVLLLPLQHRQRDGWGDECI